MRTIIGIALIAAGVLLLVLGISAADSFASDVSRFFTGNPTDRAVWLMIGGVAAIITGLAASLLPGRDRRVLP
jgi:hypothetical protein